MFTQSFGGPAKEGKPVQKGTGKWQRPRAGRGSEPINHFHRLHGIWQSRGDDDDDDE